MFLDSSSNRFPTLNLLHNVFSPNASQQVDGLQAAFEGCMMLVFLERLPSKKLWKWKVITLSVEN